MMRRQMKLAAVLVVVVLALTGFSTSAGKSRSGKSGGSGGGCSSSKKSNNGYRDTDYDDYDDSSSSGSSSSGSSYGTPTPTASDAPVVRVIRCAVPRKGKRRAVPSSLVELRANEPGSQAYEIDVRFIDAMGRTVDTAETTANLDGGEVRTLTVRMESPGKVTRVKRCEVTAVAL